MSTETVEGVVKIVCETIEEISCCEVKPEMTMGELSIDSLGMIEVVMLMEEKLRVEISDAYMDTVGKDTTCLEIAEEAWRVVHG